MTVHAHAVFHCPRCHSTFEPPTRITELAALHQFSESVGLMICPRCHAHVILADEHISFECAESPDALQSS